MSYTKQTWATGDTVTASKLNHMEDGIAGAGGGIVLDLVTSTPLTMTFEEIANAIGSGTNVYIKSDNHDDWSSDYAGSMILGRVVKAYVYDGTYRIAAEWCSIQGNISSTDAIFSPAMLIFSATSYDAYPVFYKMIEVQLSATVVTVQSQYE